MNSNKTVYIAVSGTTSGGASLLSPETSFKSVGGTGTSIFSRDVKLKPFRFFFCYQCRLFLNFISVCTRELHESASMARCMYYDPASDSFSSNGCRVGSCSSLLATQCFCNHLTAFSNVIRAPPVSSTSFSPSIM